MIKKEITVCWEKDKIMYSGPSGKFLYEFQKGAHIKGLQGLFCVLQLFPDLYVLRTVLFTGTAFDTLGQGRGVFFQ